MEALEPKAISAKEIPPRRGVLKWRDKAILGGIFAFCGLIGLLIVGGVLTWIYEIVATSLAFPLHSFGVVISIAAFSLASSIRKDYLEDKRINVLTAIIIIAAFIAGSYLLMLISKQVQ